MKTKTEAPNCGTTVGDYKLSISKVPEKAPSREETP
jgi:hypothetical protein